MVYYIEYVFVENFIIDFILLFITGKLIKSTIIFKRLVIASMVGALYVVLTLYIGKEFMTYFIVKFSISVLMIMIAYDSKGIITNIRVIICFYITSLLMVGIITALYYITYDKLTVNAIIISLFMGYGALHFFFKEVKDRILKHNYKRSVTVSIATKSKNLQAYIDTGNELTDPVTGKPVMVVSIDCIKDLLDEGLYERIMDFYKDGSYENLFNEGNSLRIIKFNTISTKGENMVCIVPDKIEIVDGIGSINAIMGVYPKKISKGSYDALLFKKLLDWEMETKNEHVSC
ncbi:MAG: sigma-E processing peptidase SpoIIGA [Tissierellia bacterium]|nr:sigma-E processing peptidase SpoIIGA [Tissierellia bacterium]